MAKSTKSELLAILAQLGALGYTRHHTLEELTEAIRAFGLTDTEIEAEVAEQRDRATPGRLT